MKRLWNLTVLVAMACVAVAGRAAAQETPLIQSTDRATGAVVKVFRMPTGPRLDVVSPTISLSKHLAAGGVIVTTLRDDRESMRIEVSQTRLVVNGTRGAATATTSDAAGAAKARDLVAKSPLTKRAAALIAKMGFGENSTVQPLLLTTRAFLLTMMKDGSGMAELKQWMNNMRARTHVVPVALPAAAFAQKSSSQCWKEYGDELLAAFDDFLVCFNNIKWYDIFFPVERCEIVYEARILAAFAGWMSCLGVL